MPYFIRLISWDDSPLSVGQLTCERKIPLILCSLYMKVLSFHEQLVNLYGISMGQLSTEDVINK